jgi:hypothetical protein
MKVGYIIIEKLTTILASVNIKTFFFFDANYKIQSRLFLSDYKI